VKSAPAWREREAALPTASNADSPPAPMLVQTSRRRYSTRNCMNIVSAASPVPGIEPRIPSVSGCAALSQTSIVAHKAGEAGGGSGAAAAASAAASGAAPAASAQAATRPGVRTGPR